MLYWNEIINDLSKIITLFCSTWFEVCMTKLQMFYVWAFCHTTDINTTVQFCPNRPEHILVKSCNSCCDVKDASVVLTSRKNAWKQIFVFPLRYYANCVSITLTVLVTLKVSISFIVTLYLDTLYKGRQNFCLHDGPNYLVCSQTENFVEYSKLHSTSFETHITLYERLQASECLENCDVVWLSVKWTTARNCELYRCAVADIVLLETV
jgi:hypothetical protein